jgi:hypothetical protein
LPDLRSILALEPVPFEYMGVPLKLKRPSLIDLVEAVEANAVGTAHARAWAIHRHVLDENGTPVFATPETALACPSGLAAKTMPMIEELYKEGSD